MGGRGSPEQNEDERRQRIASEVVAKDQAVKGMVMWTGLMILQQWRLDHSGVGGCLVLSEE